MNTFKDIALGYKKAYLDKGKVVLTNFLTLSEQAMLTNILKHHVEFSFFGGCKNPELKRAVIGNVKLKDFKVVAYKIVPKDKSFTLTHQNIMGSLLSLGLKKDVLGDILADQSVFFVKEEISDFLELNFISIAQTAITIEIIDGSSLTKTNNFIENTYFVNSMRLDLIVSKITSLSRTEASIMIKNGLIKVNHLEVLNSVKQILVNDVLSIRKSGRFFIIDNKGHSKKGNIVLKIGKYV